jgi:hypothetical protein
MDHSNPKSHLGIVIVLGSVWGLSEAALGMGLRSCAAQVSGSLMTGVAFFFMAAGWAISRRVSGALLIESVESRLVKTGAQKRLEYILCPTAFIICLTVVALLRLV